MQLCYLAPKLSLQTTEICRLVERMLRRLHYYIIAYNTKLRHNKFSMLVYTETQNSYGFSYAHCQHCTIAGYRPINQGYAKRNPCAQCTNSIVTWHMHVSIVDTRIAKQKYGTWLSTRSKIAWPDRPVIQSKFVHCQITFW